MLPRSYVFLTIAQRGIPIEGYTATEALVLACNVDRVASRASGYG